MVKERKKGQETSNKGKGSMTVAEARHKGGTRTSEIHGREFYTEIGHKGGQRARELIEAGRKNAGEQSTRSDTATRRGSTSGSFSSSRAENR